MPSIYALNAKIQVTYGLVLFDILTDLSLSLRLPLTLPLPQAQALALALAHEGR